MDMHGGAGDENTPRVEITIRDGTKDNYFPIEGSSVRTQDQESASLSKASPRVWLIVLSEGQPLLRAHALLPNFRTEGFLFLYI